MDKNKVCVIVAPVGHHHPTVTRRLVEHGFTVLENPDDVAVVDDNFLHAINLDVQDLDFEPAIVEQRDFGKRGKKNKRKKDWHR